MSLRHQLIAAGYLRKIYLKSNIFIPNEIAQLIQRFYDPFIHWDFTDNELDNFFKTENGKCIKSEPFSKEGIIFELRVFPKGDHQEHNNQVIYCLALKYIPLKYSYFMVCFELQLQTSRKLYKFKALSKWDKLSQNQHQSWDRNVNIQQLINETNLNFKCSIEIFKIKSRKFQSTVKDYIKNIQIPIVSKYQWVIDMTTIKINSYCTFWSDTFGNGAWCLQLRAPNMFYLVMLGIPHDIDTITVSIIWAHNNTANDRLYYINSKQPIKHTLSIDNNYCKICRLYEIPRSGGDYFQFSIIIQVVDVCKNEQDIDEKEWFDYGITKVKDYKIKKRVVGLASAHVISYYQCKCSNVMNPDKLPMIMNPNVNDVWMTSNPDVDGQMLIQLTFCYVVELKKIMIRSINAPSLKYDDYKDNGDDFEPCGPKTVKLFANMDKCLGFDEAENMKETEKIVMTLERLNGKRIKLKSKSFKICKSLQIFVVDNQKNSNHTYINRIELLGKINFYQQTNKDENKILFSQDY